MLKSPKWHMTWNFRLVKCQVQDNLQEDGTRMGERAEKWKMNVQGQERRCFQDK